MQTSTTVITVEALNITQACNGSPQPFPRPPVTMPTTKRTMTAPALSLTIPETQVSKDDTPAKYIMKNGNAIPHNELQSEEESVRSSICHSPSWDDATARQKRKERQEAGKKRKTEKKKQETEAKHAHKMKNRLTKRPPTNDRLSKMVFPPDHALSTPTTPTLPETKEERKTPSVHTRSRRGSLDMGIRSLLSWKSSRTTSAETSPTKGISPSNESGGFIGGLKLRLSQDATAQELMSTSSSVPDDQHAIPTKQDKTPPSPNASKATSINRTLPEQFPVQATMRTPSYEVLVPKPPHVSNGLSGDTARVAVGSQPSAEHVPIIININRGQKTRAPVSNDSSTDCSTQSGGYSQGYSSSSSKVRSSETSRQTASDSNSRGQRAETTLDNHNRIVHKSDTSMRRPGPTDLGTSSNYVQSQSRQSHDVALVAFEDQDRATRGNDLDTPQRWSPESFHTVKSRMSIESIKTATTPRARIVCALPFFKEDYVVPPLNPELSPTSSSIAESHELKSSKGIKGLKDAARAAFSRDDYLSSDDLINPDIAKALTAPRRFPLTRTAASIAPENISGQVPESEKLLGEALRRSTHATPSSIISTHSLSCPRIPGGSSNQGSGLATVRSKGHNTRASRGPSTDSSEDYSTYDDSSNVTTPISSTPTSQKSRPSELRSGMNEHDSRNSSTGTLPQKGKNSVVMSGARPPLADGEERFKPPKASERPLGKACQVSKADIDADLIHKPSLPHATSTLDLSFLPALKHEALTRSPNAKESRVGAGLSQPALIRPPPRTESEGSSFTSRAHPHLPSTKQQPIAKMLVECCSCHYYHDMPSKVYSCMASPASVVEDKERGVHGLVSTSVKCPWCGHGMSTACCGGWAAVIYLREKLH